MTQNACALHLVKGRVRVSEGRVAPSYKEFAVRSIQEHFRTYTVYECAHFRPFDGKTLGVSREGILGCHARENFENIKLYAKYVHFGEFLLQKKFYTYPTFLLMTCFVCAAT